ncbi:hypothetical protein MLD38_024487 [Melastoma candidum]|uniref:Uncharacterized protein n=1 Tax=Melastoma candidum TaxID=119954 RepID=A0ACB9NTS8_9MYRT|nr:hypothetical protein MLD38_024487 [Melastoma candidum]
MATFLQVISALIAYAVVANAVDTSLVKRICNGDTSFAFDSPYGYPDSFASIFPENVFTTPNFSFYYTNHFFYGRGSCSISLTPDGCHACMQSAFDQLFGKCSRHGAGAQIELKDCKLRYEEYDF